MNIKIQDDKKDKKINIVIKKKLSEIELKELLKESGQLCFNLLESETNTDTATETESEAAYTTEENEEATKTVTGCSTLTPKKKKRITVDDTDEDVIIN